MRVFFHLMCAATIAMLLDSAFAQRVEAQQQMAPLFRADVRLVEIYATVFDHKGRRIGNLAPESFEVLDQGIPQRIISFETSGSSLTCAILLDATGSMREALPALKNATIKLIDQLRDSDWYAVYGFSTSLNLLVGFTQDKKAGKRAVMNIKAGGATALFDALAQVSKDLSPRKGKKAIIVFTDGEDNSSVLNAGAAMAQARKIGIPVYTVAEGDALHSRDLLRQLGQLARITGGMSLSARKPGQIEDSFATVLKDVNNTYMLAYPVPDAGESNWHSIQVSLKGMQGFKVRAKEGYTLK